MKQRGPLMGLEPTISTLRVRHATHCATPPLCFNGITVLFYFDSEEIIATSEYQLNGTTDTYLPLNTLILLNTCIGRIAIFLITFRVLIT